MLCPSVNYQGPTEMMVYWDSLFGFFLVRPHRNRFPTNGNSRAGHGDSRLRPVGATSTGDSFSRREDLQLVHKQCGTVRLFDSSRPCACCHRSVNGERRYPNGHAGVGTTNRHSHSVIRWQGSTLVVRARFYWCVCSLLSHNPRSCQRRDLVMSNYMDGLCEQTYSECQ